MGGQGLSSDIFAPRPPSVALALAEVARTSLETTSLLLSAPFVNAAPRGEGQDVVVLPGFACSHRATFLLRSYLRSLGYKVHDWGLGRNLGARTIGADGERLAERIDKISQDAGAPVSLVGHSLGGVMSRLYAEAEPARVRQVICLGSPFVGDPRAVNRLVLKLHDRLSRVPAAPASGRRPARLQVPFTAIYSRTDGIVSMSDTTDVAGPRAENIEVFSSHCGLVAHPAVFYAVADRLALPADQWRPVRAQGLAAALVRPGAEAARAGAARRLAEIAVLYVRRCDRRSKYRRPAIPATRPQGLRQPTVRANQ